ncbi:unnamed protein product [Cladocopium goreaui]|uniref:Protein NO VEIN (Protein EMBRYO DEFECTIVE 2597) n=1 Tax=Cladocopium goreaui TaxID=2562237 RepID=A0A9P1BMP9_9DINO|nr:unnamed protein product [Cladocopium goreaui]
MASCVTMVWETEGFLSRSQIGGWEEIDIKVQVQQALDNTERFGPCLLYCLALMRKTGRRRTILMQLKERRIQRQVQRGISILWDRIRVVEWTVQGREDGEGEPLEEGEEAQLKRKEFKTRIYDLDDLRVQKKRMKIDPLPHENLLPKEEREKVGRWGEQFVYHYLKQKLESEDAGKRVLWVNEIEETGFQYDLRIEDGNGEVDAYVEVKTSRAKDKQLFEMSYREWTFAQKEGGKFVIFRVSNAGKEDVELCSITNPFRQWKEMNLGLCLTL